jgi:hypothetical protein
LFHLTSPYSFTYISKVLSDPLNSSSSFGFSSIFPDSNLFPSRKEQRPSRLLRLVFSLCRGITSSRKKLLPHAGPTRQLVGAICTHRRRNAYQQFKFQFLLICDVWLIRRLNNWLYVDTPECRHDLRRIPSSGRLTGILKFFVLLSVTLFCVVSLTTYAAWPCVIRILTAGSKKPMAASARAFVFFALLTDQPGGLAFIV